MTANKPDTELDTPILDAESPTFLYRFFDSGDVLLYVGITFSPWTRWAAHRATKDWWSLVDRITAERYPNRHAAAVAEVQAIQEERPVHNVVHRPGDPQEDADAELEEISGIAPHQARLAVLVAEADRAGDRAVVAALVEAWHAVAGTVGGGTQDPEDLTPVDEWLYEQVKQIAAAYDRFTSRRDAPAWQRYLWASTAQQSAETDRAQATRDRGKALRDLQAQGHSLRQLEARSKRAGVVVSHQGIRELIDAADTPIPAPPTGDVTDLFTPIPD